MTLEKSKRVSQSGLTIKDSLMYQYRNKQYEYTECQTYTGETASWYTCSDFSHAPFNLKSFATSEESVMKTKIDDMLDNIKKYEEKYILNTNANEVFYETLTYKGD
jgi:hypothetical protein